MKFLNKEELNNYLNEYCDATCAHTKATCGNTCCTPNDDELYQFDKPKKLKPKNIFIEFLKNIWFGILLTIGFILILSILLGLLYLLLYYTFYAFMILGSVAGIILLHELGKTIRKGIDNNR